MGQEQIRVVIVDDHPLILEGIEAASADFPRIEIVGQAQSGPEALEEVKEKSPDVVLLDVILPGIDGLSVLDVLKAESPDLKIVILTSQLDEGVLAAGKDLGHSGMISKAAGWDEILRTVETVADGGTPADPVPDAEVE